jgi:NAD(P)-dependent dehydrogenase (short-subunit alcohol dehydrogenase family)
LNGNRRCGQGTWDANIKEIIGVVGGFIFTAILLPSSYIHRDVNNSTMATRPDFNAKTDASTVAAAFSSHIKGRTFLITGVSSNGLGQSTAEALAVHDPALLILTGRTETKVQQVIDKLLATHAGSNCRYLHLDLSSLASVRVAAQEILDDPDVSQIDVVICNAGVMFIPNHETSVDGYEMQFATNHLGHFLFVSLILTKLKAAAANSPTGAVRVVNLSSAGAQFSPIRFSDPNFTRDQMHLPEDERANGKAIETYFGPQPKIPYNPHAAYGQSKTANILFSLGLTLRLFDNYGIKSYALHPGGIMTDLWRHMDTDSVRKIVSGREDSFKSLEQGSSTTLVAALDPGLPTPTAAGKNLYLDDCQLVPAVAWARSLENSEKLWKLSETLVDERFRG